VNCSEVQPLGSVFTTVFPSWLASLTAIQTVGRLGWWIYSCLPSFENSPLSTTVVYRSAVHYGSVVHWPFLQWSLLYLAYLNIFEINLICIHNEQVRND